MHNVLSLAGQGNIERSSSFREQSFDSLFVQGFWKKLVFMLDPDSSCNLCYAMQDYESFRLNYIVEKLGKTDPDVIKGALVNEEKFAELIHDTSDTAQSFKKFCLQILERVVQPDLAHELIETWLVSGKIQRDKISHFHKLGQDPILTTSVAKHIMTLINLKELECVLRLPIEKQLTLIDHLIETLRVPSNQYQMLRAIYQPLGITWLDGLEPFNSISANYCIVHRSSSLMKAIAQYNENALDVVRISLIAQKLLDL